MDLNDELFFRGLFLVGGAFLAVAALLRVSRGHTLAKMNAFELLVSVAIAGLLVAGLVRPELSLVYLLAASAGLVVVQVALTALARKLRGTERLWKSEPVLVFRRGHFLRGAMRRFRVSEEEVARAIRAQGWRQFSDVEAVVLEPDGALAVFGAEGKRPAAFAPGA